MGELAKIDAKEKPSRGGRTLRDGEIYRDMAFCAPAIASKDECESSKPSKYPLSKEEKSRGEKCAFDEEAGTCAPKWMKSKDNEVRKMFYRDGGFADAEIEETNRQYAMAENLRRTNRIQRRPSRTRPWWRSAGHQHRRLPTVPATPSRDRGNRGKSFVDADESERHRLPFLFFPYNHQSATACP